MQVYTYPRININWLTLTFMMIFSNTKGVTAEAEMEQLQKVTDLCFNVTGLAAWNWMEIKNIFKSCEMMGGWDRKQIC